MSELLRQLTSHKRLHKKPVMLLYKTLVNSNADYRFDLNEHNNDKITHKCKSVTAENALAHKVLVQLTTHAIQVLILSPHPTKRAA